MATEPLQPIAPLTLTVFGITGDLSARMLLPALYDLELQGLLPRQLRIVGVSRRQGSVEELLAKAEAAVTQKNGACDQKVLRSLGSYIEFFTMDLTDTAGYRSLKRRLDAVEAEAGTCMNRLFYLAVPAQAFSGVVERLGQTGLNHSCPHGSGQARLLVEKPFGHDLASAQRLITTMRQHFAEEQIYRIDHFLAKETTQNILAFRFQNSLFKAVWDKSCISHILISATETIGIEGRSVFYEQTGALRDMIQSHALQLLALAAMEIPGQFTASAIHAKKLALLENIEPALPKHAVRGQYKGYKNEINSQLSHTETYAALKLSINSERWRGVPILVRSGKALADKTTAITVVFSDHDQRTTDNTLTIQLAPFEGISLHLRAKKPGFDNAIEDVSMDFCYNQSFRGERQPTAYERVLMDAFRGDQTLFATSKEVLASWRVVEPLLQAWQENGNGLEQYAKGSWGPQAAQKLAQSTGQAWPTEVIKTCAVHTAPSL